MIRRLSIKQFMGIEELTLTLGPGGALVEGKNGSGKTSILSAVRAALDAQGISASAVRKGATKSEILIDIEELAALGARINAIQVRRTITAAGGGQLKVSDPATGASFPSPQTFLAGLLGASTLDPLRLFTEKDEAAQRRMILEAIPSAVSFGQIESWVPGIQKGTVAQILGISMTEFPEDLDAPLPGHGLEVIGKIRKVLYQRRTEANRVTAERAGEVTRAERELDAQREVYRVRAAADGLPDAPPPTVEQAMAQVAAAEEALRQIDRQKSAAAAEERRGSKTRERITLMRSEASERRQKAPLAPREQDFVMKREEIEAGHRRVSDKEAEVKRLREELEAAENELGLLLATSGTLQGQLVDLERRLDTAEEEQQAIARIEEQALELEAAVAPMLPGPTDEDSTAAEQALIASRALVARAKQAELVDAQIRALGAARDNAAVAQRTSSTLDHAVKALSDDAPAALLAAQNGIPGLSLDGEDISLDGVALSRICGEERMRFAITVARRLNAKSKLLIVDGLEAVDEDNLARFVDLATAEGYQLLATRVGRGDTVLRPIGEAPAAEEEASS